MKKDLSIWMAPVHPTKPPPTKPKEEDSEELGDDENN